MRHEKRISKPRLRIFFVDAWLLVRLLWERAVRTFEALLVPLLLLGSVTLIIVTINRVFAWQSMAHKVAIPKDRIAAENQIFLTLAQIFGGGFVLTGLYFTGKNLILTRQGQRAERVSYAVESLADVKVDRRIAGVLSLGALLEMASPEYQAVAGIICSFVREATMLQEYREAYPDKPRADIQAAIYTIGSRSQAYHRGEWYRLDLSDAYLAGADFSNGNYRGIIFRRAILQHANFHRAHVEHAIFEDAQLEDSRFLQADLRRASFFCARMGEAKFRRSALYKTNLTRAILDRASFDDTVIQRTTFGNASLKGATFRGARLIRCNFARVSRNSVDFGNAIERKVEGFI